MAPHDEQTGGRVGPVSAIARYAVLCLALGAAVAGLVVAVVDGRDGESGATLPPVRETQLVKAVRASGCELRRAGAGRELGREVDGARAVPARAGVYDDAPPVDRLVAALRRGVVVVAYREPIAEERLEQLRALQRVLPTGTIVAPDEHGTRYAVMVAAYRRVLGCRRFADSAIDALRLFRGRYVGTGPDR